MSTETVEKVKVGKAKVGAPKIKSTTKKISPVVTDMNKVVGLTKKALTSSKKAQEYQNKTIDLLNEAYTKAVKSNAVDQSKYDEFKALENPTVADIKAHAEELTKSALFKKQIRS